MAALELAEDIENELIRIAMSDKDQGIAAMLLQLAIRALTSNDPLSAGMKSYLVFAIGNVIQSPQALNIACGATGKGGNKQGEHGLRIAIWVYRKKLELGTVESAWHAVSELRHCGLSTVQKHWAKWKGTAELFVKFEQSEQEAAKR